MRPRHKAAEILDGMGMDANRVASFNEAAA